MNKESCAKLLISLAGLIIGGVSCIKGLKNKKIFISERNKETNSKYIWNNPQVWYLHVNNKVYKIWTTEKKVYDAEYHINRNYAILGEITLGEVMQDFGIDVNNLIDRGELNDNIKTLGWSSYLEPDYGYSFIDFTHREIKSGPMKGWHIYLPFQEQSLCDEE